MNLQGIMRAAAAKVEGKLAEHPHALAASRVRYKVVRCLEEVRSCGSPFNTYFLMIVPGVTAGMLCADAHQSESLHAAGVESHYGDAIWIEIAGDRVLNVSGDRVRRRMMFSAQRVVEASVIHDGKALATVASEVDESSGLVDVCLNVDQTLNAADRLRLLGTAPTLAMHHVASLGTHLAYTGITVDGESLLQAVRSTRKPMIETNERPAVAV